MLKNRVSCYERSLESRVRKCFEEEIEDWIKEGILVPWEEEVQSGIIPLVQPTKNKVRPVLDFREAGGYVECHTGDGVPDVCGETLSYWRRMSGASTIIDLKAAYLQLWVAKKSWKYQLVNDKVKTYALTRLGFGLNSAPQIMLLILNTVLRKNDNSGSCG